MGQDENTHWRKVMNTKFLNGDEIDDGGIAVKIKGYTQETFFSPQAKKDEEHVILQFETLEKPMILTNRKAKQISKVVGSPLMKEWIGKDVQLVPVSEKHFGELFKVINIKSAVPKVLPDLTPESPQWAKAKGMIDEGKTDVATIKKHYKLSEVNRLILEKKNDGQ